MVFTGHFQNRHSIFSLTSSMESNAASRLAVKKTMSFATSRVPSITKSEDDTMLTFGTVKKISLSRLASSALECNHSAVFCLSRSLDFWFASSSRSLSSSFCIVSSSSSDSVRSPSSSSGFSLLILFSDTDDFTSKALATILSFHCFAADCKIGKFSSCASPLPLFEATAAFDNVLLFEICCVNAFISSLRTRRRRPMQSSFSQSRT
mmetsp:Transcript_4346/g.13318  ORF Transcript_4346/g.13318 Transcript_4346/m.13318 type:complete len:207 (-) Transcript_4346:408-1028(-)